MTALILDKMSDNNYTQQEAIMDMYPYLGKENKNPCWKPKEVEPREHGEYLTYGERTDEKGNIVPTYQILMFNEDGFHDGLSVMTHWTEFPKPPIKD